MSERTPLFEHDDGQQLFDEDADSTAPTATPSLGEGVRSKSSNALVRLIVTLEGALRAELPIAKRLSLVKDLQPTVTKATALMPKPVVSARQLRPGTTKIQTLEQHLGCLMTKNLQLAIRDIGRSGVPDTQVSTRVRLWLTTSLFHSLGGLIEYSVLWDKPYPSNVWQSLHELYFHIGSREDLAHALNSYGAESGFDADIAYKRLLLLGLARRLTSVTDRLTQSFDALQRLAEESRLERIETHAGAFGLFVVEIARDEPPYISGAIEPGFRGWVFIPPREFSALVEH